MPTPPDEHRSAASDAYSASPTHCAPPYSASALFEQKQVPRELAAEVAPPKLNMHVRSCRCSPRQPRSAASFFSSMAWISLDEILRSTARNCTANRSAMEPDKRNGAAMDAPGRLRPLAAAAAWSWAWWLRQTGPRRSPRPQCSAAGTEAAPSLEPITSLAASSCSIQSQPARQHGGG